MKIRIEMGEIHDTHSKTIHHYVRYYKQPLRNYLMYRVYHAWDMRFLKLHKLAEKLDERYEKWQHRKVGRENCKHATQGFDRNGNLVGKPRCIRLPYTARQDCKCFDLSQKNRIELGMVFLDEVPQSKRKTEPNVFGEYKTVSGPPGATLNLRRLVKESQDVPPESPGLP